MSQFPPNQPPQQPYYQGQPPYPPQQPYLPPVKPKKPFYKRVWFVILAGLVLIIIIASLANGGKDSPAGGLRSPERPKQLRRRLPRPPKLQQRRPRRWSSVPPPVAQAM